MPQKVDPRPVREVMLEKLQKRHVVDANTGCWVWSGCWDKHGFGLVRLPGTRATSVKVAVHRIAAWLWLGLPLDSPKLVGHDPHFCLTPACFNPEHLRIYDDRQAHGYAASQIQRNKRKRGEAHHAARMSEFEAQCIIDAVLEGKEDDGDIAERLNEAAGRRHITAVMVGRVRRRKTWKHLWRQRSNPKRKAAHR